MIRFLLSSGMAIALAMGAVVADAAGPDGDTADRESAPARERDQDSRKLLEEVLMARLTRELALDGEQTVLMVRHLAEYRERMAALRRERTVLVRALRESVRESKDESLIESRLEELLAHDGKVAAARTGFLDPESLELTAWQQARLFLFIQDFEGDMRRLLKRAQDRQQGAATQKDRKLSPPEDATAETPPGGKGAEGTPAGAPVESGATDPRPVQ